MTLIYQVSSSINGSLTADISINGSLTADIAEVFKDAISKHHFHPFWSVNTEKVFNALYILLYTSGQFKIRSNDYLTKHYSDAKDVGLSIVLTIFDIFVI